MSAISLEGACDLVTYIAWISLINSKLGFMICISIALLEAMKFQNKNTTLWSNNVYQSFNNPTLYIFCET